MTWQAREDARQAVIYACRLGVQYQSSAGGQSIAWKRISSPLSFAAAAPVTGWRYRRIFSPLTMTVDPRHSAS
jgi:hypothetical protein